eukprot:Blabericola_migrator_1__5779@NODE_292_length_10275_cov_168_705525_g240_i0_p3_GENE_NODE_292_length_10275_cov_168_705525_g240_i0NODE_292_length_10275_cov_168_705525_g240_i0_p3_ORF_typecomplete_len494_score104_69Thioredoxin/PF00085_20/0_0068Thioredoxin/PF00085_20/5_6e02Thioredoxin/PF00085_20/2_5e13Thioredoxin_6/PF13848_6/1_1e02Thioredoxin_6/PF13848_6/4_4e09Thioredoxin_6/PF13848_6/4_3TraF/PF13728_6/0_015TraF/PF13728_6/9_6e02TraF/PF13728_6/1_4e05Thioredoxin_9/PF14595_6/0_85Thioredoxin_9/PF14595_6/1e0
MKLLLLFLPTYVWARRNKPGQQDTPVLSVNSPQNLTAFLEAAPKRDMALLGFTKHPPCKWCGDFVDILTDLAKLLGSDAAKVPVGLVNIDVMKKKGGEAEIEAFDLVNVPALIMIQGSKRTPYVGPLTPSDLLGWIVKAAPVTLRECQDLYECEEPDGSERSPFKIVIQVKDREGAGWELAQQLVRRDVFDGADGLRLDYRVFVKEDLNTTRSDAVARLYAHHDEERRVSTVVADFAEAKRWILRHGRPLFGALDEVSAPYYQKMASKWVVLCGEEDDYTHFRIPMKQVGREKGDEYNVVWVDSANLMQTLEDMFGSVECPSILVMNEQFRKYEYSYGKITTEDVLGFIAQAETGFARSKLKSEDPQEVKIEKHFLKMVGSRIDEWMEANLNTVRLLYVYAPWCSHCKQLAPQLEEMVKDYKETLGVRFRAAKMDGTLNDLSPDTWPPIDHYPTLIILPEGSMEKILYKGRSLKKEPVKEWIDSHVTEKRDEL